MFETLIAMKPTKRRVFYSFHYKPDAWRASTVRNIGVVEGNQPATDNDWEKVKSGKGTAIKQWISQQMKGRSCTVVLVGTHTAGRRWIDYEIIESWNKGMGIVGIYVHGIADNAGQTTSKGKNPFKKSRLSSIAKCYDPKGKNSKEKYNWITKHLSDVIEEAISVRRQY
ncbi:MAG: TIR domain-containing protein [Aestuariivita sp.]|nr:TIR domain-containing protein [Aestuariivita sp.]